MSDCIGSSCWPSPCTWQLKTLESVSFTASVRTQSTQAMEQAQVYIYTHRHTHTHRVEMKNLTFLVFIIQAWDLYQRSGSLMVLRSILALTRLVLFWTQIWCRSWDVVVYHTRQDPWCWLCKDTQRQSSTYSNNSVQDASRQVIHGIAQPSNLYNIQEYLCWVWPVPRSKWKMPLWVVENNRVMIL